MPKVGTTERCGIAELPTGNRAGLLQTRAESARRQLECCQLCEHRCEVNRAEGELGVCRAGPVARVFRHRVEYGEELELVPSHIFYLSGCDLRCVFCIAEANAFDPERGVPLTSEFFAQAVHWGKQQGARNVQWLGGEATIHLAQILEVMAACPEQVRMIWKSNFHFSLDTLDLLRGIADVYVADFKFGNDHCATSLAGVDNYLAIVTRNMLLAARQGELIIRHLLMPGHIECCLKPVVEWVRRHLPDGKFSLRNGYMPAWQARHFGELARHVSTQEYSHAVEIAGRAKLNLID